MFRVCVPYNLDRHDPTMLAWATLLSALSGASGKDIMWESSPYQSTPYFVFDTEEEAVAFKLTYL